MNVLNLYEKVLLCKMENDFSHPKNCLNNNIKKLTSNY